MGLCALACAGLGADPPVDPWTDAEWLNVTYGITPVEVRSIRFSEQLYTEVRGSASPVSTREAVLDFEPDGRIARLDLSLSRDFGPPQRRLFRYAYRSDLRLSRIDEDRSPTPAMARNYDEAGRLIEELERTGAVVRRTRIKYDSAGREVERVVDEGSSKEASRETRSYRRDGTLLRLEQEGRGMQSRTVSFDASGRPVHIAERDLFERSTTRIEYPDALSATHRIKRFAATREGIGTHERTIFYRVRRASDFILPHAPDRPMAKRVADAGSEHEVQFERDARDQPLVERQLDKDGRLVCSCEWAYHAAGPPTRVRTTRQARDVACTLDNGDLENTVETDVRGRWVRQTYYALTPDGSRRRLAEQVRAIDYR